MQQAIVSKNDFDNRWHNQPCGANDCPHDVGAVDLPLASSMLAHFLKI